MYGERIKRLRVNAGMTQKDLASKLKMSEIAVRTWESGNRIPSANVIAALAEIFHVSSDYILETSTPAIPLTEAEQALVESYRMLDQYGKNAVDSICYAERVRVFEERNRKPHRHILLFDLPSAAGITAPIDNHDFDIIEVNESVPYDADFAVKISGDSMAPYIIDKDIVYVRRQQSVDTGDVGIFSVNGAMYCKLFNKNKDGGITLVSANSDMQNLNITINADSNDDVRCYGKVITKTRVPFPRSFDR
jgi:SOS-response transcriptional repressors (RecA-mediated autopeptidases)